MLQRQLNQSHGCAAARVGGLGVEGLLAALAAPQGGEVEGEETVAVAEHPIPVVLDDAPAVELGGEPLPARKEGASDRARGS